MTNSNNLEHPERPQWHHRSSLTPLLDNLLPAMLSITSSLKVFQPALLVRLICKDAWRVQTEEPKKALSGTQSAHVPQCARPRRADIGITGHAKHTGSWYSTQVARALPAHRTKQFVVLVQPHKVHLYNT